MSTIDCTRCAGTGVSPTEGGACRWCGGNRREPAIGEESTCTSCRKPVRFVGKYWEHIGATYRHPVRPKREA
jgi:hypothetical protein